MHLLPRPACKMEMQVKAYSLRVEKEGSSSTKLMPHNVEILRENLDDDLKFDKLQQLDEDISYQEIKTFGDFVAREATIDEEYWAAAWLRATSHWEDRPNERFADSYIRQYAEQEYNALKNRCKGYHGQTNSCIVTVKKDDKIVIKSVVGTLDLSIRYLLQEESFPGEKIKEAPQFCNLEKNRSSYGYISNLCVARSSRRNGIAINMMKFAVESAQSKGVEQIFVHVDRRNKTARLLYEKLGFEIVEKASPQLVEEQTYLLQFRI